jgi:hypothetical protein
MNNKKAVAEKCLQINAIKLSPDYPLGCRSNKTYLYPCSISPKEHGLDNRAEGIL